MRLIDADEIIKRSHDVIIGNGTKHRCFDTTLIHEIPTVDAEPVRHGMWITKSTGGEFFDCCSECGYVEWDAPNKYCPHCGSRMDKE